MKKRDVDLERQTAETVAAIREIAALKPYDLDTGLGKTLQWLRWILERGFAMSLALFIASTLFAVLLRKGTAVHEVGLPLVELLLLGGVLCYLLPMLSFFLEMTPVLRLFAKPGDFFGAEFDHDMQLAVQLCRHDAEVLERADKWIEQKIKRLERRLGRFIGGGDKVALLVIVGLGWAAWKELNGQMLPDLTYLSINWLHVGFGSWPA